MTKNSSHECVNVASITSSSSSSSSSSSPMKSCWSPSSWRSFPIRQQATYPDEEELTKVLTKLAKLPPLVSVREVEDLREQLAQVAEGKRFLLQGGDCAERFQDCDPSIIEKKLRILLQMSFVLVWGARLPTVRVARLAGQFAKPRSKDTEIMDGQTVPSYRGENVNGFAKHERTPDPQRLLDGYFHSAATMNFARVMLKDGFGDIHDAGKWDLGFVQSSRKKHEYQHMVQQVHDCLSFMQTCGVQDASSLSTIELFTSHEGLGLALEEALTRKVGSNRYYNLGAAFLWIGDRTRSLVEAHVEYFRGIANPIGIKVGPSMKTEELVPLIQRLWPNPQETPGKITLFTRYGAGKVAQLLPLHIKAVQEAGLKVIWSCDPCHGNTIEAENGYKTRKFEDILSELQETIAIHDAMNSRLGGVHFELTGENVTECTGGPQDLSEEDLPQRYTTYCDPRLNYAQSMEVAFLLANQLKPPSLDFHLAKQVKKRTLDDIVYAQ